MIDIASVIGFCRFWFYIYYVVVISARICFVCYPIQSEFLTILLLDYLIDAFFFIDFFYLSEKYPLSLMRDPGDDAGGGDALAYAVGGARPSFSSSHHKSTSAAANRRRARTSSSGSVNVDDEGGSPSKPHRSPHRGDDGDDVSESSGRRSGNESLAEDADALGSDAAARNKPQTASPDTVRSVDHHRSGHHVPHDGFGYHEGNHMLKKAPPKTFADRLSEPEAWLAIFMFIPFEIFLFAGDSPYYGYLRTTKLLHTWYCKRYWQGFTASIDHIVPSASGQRAIFFLLMHFLASHFSACIFFAIGYLEATKDDPDRDTLITWSKLGYYDDGGDFILTHTCAYRYIRYFYFSVNVIVSALDFIVVSYVLVSFFVSVRRRR